jgi:hypothetical protein
LPRQHGKDQSVDSVRARRVSRTGREAAPEVNDCRAIADGDHVDQLVLERGIAVDGCVDGRVQLDDFLDPRT